MLCVYKGYVCYLKYRVSTRRWVYIKESDWYEMPAWKRADYVDSVHEAYAMEDCA